MACSNCGRDGHNLGTCPKTVACSLCGRRGHNAASCENVGRCSRCGERGHNAMGCPNTVICSRCGGRGHNVATCEATNDEARAHAERLQLEEDIVTIPRGPRHTELDGAEGWFHRDLLFNDKTELERLSRAVEHAPRYVRFRDALTRIVARVHKASRFRVYVGRAGATIEHVVARFRSHEENQRALYVTPVACGPTALIRGEDWEGRAIRLVKHWERENRLCCNNSVADSVGRWPDTRNTLIYVVAAGRVDD